MVGSLHCQTGLYLEGSDQHRGWFQSSLLCQLAAGRQGAPFRSCLTHGFVVDGQGRKLSKSLGNYVDPAKLIAQQGAEIVRLWAAAEDYRDDIRLSQEIVDRLSEAYRKLRNTLRYGLANLYDFDPGKHRVPQAELGPLDRWARARLHRFLAEAREAYEAYEFHRVYRGAVDFCAIDLSARYFDMIKDRLYCSGPGDRGRRAAQTVIHEIVDALCRILAPIASFTCEEAYGHLPGHAESVFAAGLPCPAEGAFDEALEREVDALLAHRLEVQGKLEELRAKKVIGSSVDARVAIPAAGGGRFDAEGLEELFVTSEVELGAATLAEHARGTRCARCWKWRADVDSQELCGRCRRAVKEYPAPGAGSTTGPRQES